MSINNKNRAVKGYFGGKNGAGVYQTIINEIPKCKIYVEPFLGGGGVFHNLSLPDVTVINDIEPGIIDKYIHAGHGSNIRIYNTDYRAVIDIYDSTDTVIYLDPPYTFDSRKSKKKVYKFEFELKDHIDFLDYVSSLKSKVIISHYPSELYDNALKEWRKIEYFAQTRNGKAKENLYLNFNSTTILQDYRYIGKDFTDRQRIKRQNQRILNKISQLEPKQRNLLLNELSLLQYR